VVSLKEPKLPADHAPITSYKTDGAFVTEKTRLRIGQTSLSRKHGGMGATDYSIKLYGHGSKDPNEFRHDLAGVLGISVDEAEELLSRVPVVVKQGMNKREAVELHALLQSIAAWSILETPENLSIPEQRPEKPIYRAIVEDFGEQESLSQDIEGHPRVWLGILLGLIVFFGLFTLAGLLGSIGSVSRSLSLKKPAPVEVEQSVEPSIVSESETAGSESPDIIRERIEQLEASLRFLYARRTEVKESWDLENAVSLERELSDQIRAEYRELRILKSKLERIESEEQL
jgi:hypothetical protein